MNDWLSTTWEANWRSFQYFNFYRLILAGLFFFAMLFSPEWSRWLNFDKSSPMLWWSVGYCVSVVGGLLVSVHWQRRFNIQLTFQVVLDVVVVSVLMYSTGGVSSGFGILLVVTLASASLVGRGRLVLFYAALATLAVLLTQIYGIAAHRFDPASIFQAGLISSGFFATAILARLLGQRVMLNEELARRRGEALDNQNLISQRVVERMQGGVMIVSPDGLILRWNPVAQSMFDLPKGDSLSLPEYCPALATAMLQWQKGSEKDSAAISGAKGVELQARFEGTASSTGEALIFLEDVGRVKARAQQLKLASLGRLTASIAHEIRNPLSAISHAGELLREERRGEMQDRLLKILNDNVVRLDRIVKDVLELGRQNRAQPEPFELAQFCSSFIDEFNAAEGLASDVICLQSSVPLTICFDRAHMHQVLWNLVSNALRYSTRSPASVRLLLNSSDQPEGVELHVIDNGQGVSESAREQIFEPFFTTHNQGTGLGLFIARELCAANGASLELAPQAQGGHFILAGRNNTCLLPEANDALVVK